MTAILFVAAMGLIAIIVLIDVYVHPEEEDGDE